MSNTSSHPRHSTGPVTEEGKKRSSLNALKHGLTATSPHAIERIAQEIAVDFEEILQKMRSHYRPADPLEEELVRRIARCLWRLARAEVMERRITVKGASSRPTASYDRIMKHERLVDIHLHRAMAALARKRKAEKS